MHQSPAARCPFDNAPLVIVVEPPVVLGGTLTVVREELIQVRCVVCHRVRETHHVIEEPEYGHDPETYGL